MSNASRPPTPTPKEPANQSQWRFEPLNVPTEWIESYRPGGFHPIHPGDTLGDSRYTIICKLGYGAFSTVWLADDNKQNQPVAIKVARTDAQETLEELRLYERLAGKESNRNHIVLPLDDFQHTGPNGKHRCLVFEPLGPSVGQALEGFPDSLLDVGSFDGPPQPPPPQPPATDASGSTDLTLGQKKCLLKQLLLGLDCLHSNRIAHGDLNPGNLLLSIRSLSREDLKNIRKSCEAGGKSALVRRSDGKQDLWAPRYLYVDRPLADLADMEHGISAKISDLGAAFDFDNPPAANECATPAALRAPEIVLGTRIDHKIDIWSFGCLMHEFLTGHVLFQVSGLADIPQEQNDDDHLLQMIDALRHSPEELFANWPCHARYFDENLKLIHSDVSSSETAEGELYQGPSLEEAFKEAMADKMNAEDVVCVLGLLQKVLQYEPHLRPSTQELLRDPWFQSIERP